MSVDNIFFKGDLHRVGREKHRANADARRFQQQYVELVIKHHSMYVTGQ